LTYTADEILDFAPALFKDGLEDVFDLVYTPVPEVEASFDDSVLIEAREKFFEAIDSLKKEKIIKATLELEIAGDVSSLPIKDAKDLEDWFVVSAIKESSEGEELASFEVDGKNFSVHKATAHKCPRCWRFASSAEDEVCPRCQEVVS
jgi:isoleucyl-tRNA synthetase